MLGEKIYILNILIKNIDSQLIKGGMTKMAAWAKWMAIIGGALALIGQFWGANYYLPLIGGLIAIIGGFGYK